MTDTNLPTQQKPRITRIGDVKVGDMFCEYRGGKPLRYLKILEADGARYFTYQTCYPDGEINNKTRREISFSTLQRFRPVEPVVLSDDELRTIGAELYAAMQQHLGEVK
jgi:hypothetical protein